MPDQLTRTLSAPLNTKIPVGKCEAEMTEKEMQQKIEELDKYTRYITGGQERLDQRISDVFRSIDRIEKIAAKNTEDLQLLLRKTTNGWGDTLSRHDVELKDKVTRKEFNDAMKSLRAETKSSLDGIAAQVSTLKWIFGIGLTLISGLIAAGYFIV